MSLEKDKAGQLLTYICLQAHFQFQRVAELNQAKPLTYKFKL